jgi:starch phosphorylase
MQKRFALPDSLEKLEELATNLWFSWNPDVRDLYREIDLDTWRDSGKNPVKFLQMVDPVKIDKFSKDEEFLKKLSMSWDRFTEYLENSKTPFIKNFPKMLDHSIAYFSAEYGMHESLPNYAGGLGVLAGDHTKTASDLGLPFIAVGLMYKHAYFRQEIDAGGNQVEVYTELNLEQLPIHLVTTDKNEPLVVSVPLLDHNVYLKIWEVKVGRVSVFLLDTTVDKNSEEDKNIIHTLYGGTRDTRIQQEIILGIGGMRAIRKMGLQPSVFHMNEGHSAFLGLERISELMNEGMNFKTALEYVRSTSVFTTHTPIAAGNEAFEFAMIEKYFKNIWPTLEISHERFFDLGRNTNIHQHENFSLTVLALNLSYQANGVSRLHGEVSRDMWQKVYPGVPISEIPIGHVTNGIHTFTWLHRKMIGLLDDHFGLGWHEEIRNQNFWDKIFELPNTTLWEKKQEMKNDMIRHVRRMYSKRISRYGTEKAGYPATEEILDPDVLTIGFARRFAPYKRSLLFFHDLERLKKIMSNRDKPIQILFAGKAHPANEAGKDLIRRINELSKDDVFRGKVVFVEGYNMSKGRALVSGVDVWLNTPRRPLEASGTSGQKVPINGGINFSILDGWWLEGYNTQNGWSIGQDRQYDDNDLQDIEDATSLYDTLENEILPLYYDRDKNGIPNAWIEKVKHSFHSTITQFSAHRMVWEYLQKYYMPAMKRAEKYSQEEYRELHLFTTWKNRIERLWDKVELSIKNGEGMDEDRRIFSAGEERNISLFIDSAGLSQKDLRVEIVLERHDAYREHQAMKIIPMGLVAKNGENQLEYRAHVVTDNDGSYRFNCRVLPVHPDLFTPYEARLVKWLD